jgi:hypothetical protein
MGAEERKGHKRQCEKKAFVNQPGFSELIRKVPDSVGDRTDLRLGGLCARELRVNQEQSDVSSGSS